MYASQVTWLQWIADRFEGKPVVAEGCSVEEVKSLRPYEEYQVDPNWFREFAVDGYEVA